MTDLPPDPIPEPAPDPIPEPTPEPPPVQRRHRAALTLALALAVLIVVIAASPFWAPGLIPLLPWGEAKPAPAPQQPDPVVALAARLDRVEAAQSGEKQAIAAAGNADKATLAQLDQRLRALETKPPPPPPDLSGIQQQLAALSGRIDTLDKTVKAQQAGNPTDAALALVTLQIGEAVRAARPFAAEYQAFIALAKNRPEIAAAAAPLEEPAATGVASRVVLTRELQALAAKIETVAPPPARNWRERVVGQLRGLVTIRRIDGTGDSPGEAAVDAARKALAQGDLAGAVAALGKLSGDNAEAAKPWLQMAQARLGVENALHKVALLLAARLGSAAADTPVPLMRVPIALILIAVVVAAAAFVADHPGQVDITWQGWEIETSVGVLVGAVVVVLGVLGAIGAIVRKLLRLPANFTRRRRERRRRAGYASLAGGFAAIAAGDAPEAQRSARRAAALLDDAPLTLALSAQAAQLEGDAAAARRLQTRMLERPETALLGLRGLYTEAMQAGDQAAALDLAERARRLRPQLPWAVEAVLELQIRAGLWTEARDTLADAAHRGIVPPERARRHRSAVLVELSRAAERNGEGRHAVSFAAQAVTLTPDRAAPACREVEALIALGRTRAAGKAIERAWRTAPHPELARLYDGLHPSDAPLARLTAAQRLAGENPDCEDSRVLVAEAALDARLWGEARRHLALAVAAAPPPGPSRRLCRLMARLEESEHSDAAGARQWLDRAVSAPPDPRYVCTNCGAEGSAWHALCPNCGGFDTLAWQAGIAPIRAALAPAAPPQTLLPAPSGLAPP